MKKVLLVALSAFLLFSLRLSAQTVVTDTTAGPSTWICPAGVTSITVECWGAGGGGGFAKYQYTAAGSGAGGSYINYTMPVTPGKTYNIYVGAGGIGGPDSVTNGGKGGSSYFGSTTDTLPQSAIVLAVGGNGGTSIDTTGAKGAVDSSVGGAAVTSGNLPVSGYNSSLYGAAGGDGTGTGATAGGAGANGGAGGAASTNFSASKKGYNGMTPGGGGSGAIDKTVKAGEAGGNGAVGEVQLTYFSASSVLKPASFSATAVSATEIDLTATSNNNNNNIVVVYSNTNSFIPPTTGIAAGAAGTSFIGGTVLYNGSAAGLTNQTGLLPNITYYYEAFCYDGANNFSPILKATAQTLTSNLMNSDFTGASANYFAGISTPAATVTQKFGPGIFIEHYVQDTGFTIITDTTTDAVGLMPIDTSVAGTSYTLGYAVKQGWYIDYIVAANTGYSLNATNISGSMRLSGAASTNAFGILYGIGTATTPPATFSNAISTTQSVDTGVGTKMSGTLVNFSSINAGVALKGTDNITGNNVLYVRAVFYRAYPSATVQTMYHSGLTIGGLVSSNLPVGIASFSAAASNNTIHTNWHTSTELNVSAFNVQHSIDGNSFKTIGTVNAIGKGANNYQFTDLSPVSGTNYYRLQSVDKNGNSTYSKTISVLLSANNHLSVYPNPSRGNLTVNGTHLTFIQVIDNLGRIVSTYSVLDATNPSVNVSKLQTGTYRIRTQSTDGTIKTSNFIKE